MPSFIPCGNLSDAAENESKNNASGINIETDHAIVRKDNNCSVKSLGESK